MSPILLAFAAAAQPVPPAATAPDSCQAALVRGDVDDLPGVDASTLSGASALVEFRRARGNAPFVVSRADLRGADLSGAALHNLCFIDSDLSGSNWTGARARGVGFIRTNLTGARMRGADLSLVFFRDAGLENVDARRALLRGGRLEGSWFGGSVENLRLDDADLTDFRFECGITLDDGCPVYHGGEASFRGADLSRSNLFGYGDIEGARIDGTEVPLFRLHDLLGARIAGPIRLRAGDQVVVIAPAEFRRLRSSLVDPATIADQPLVGEAPAWARPGSRALFIDAPNYFRPAFRSDPMFRAMLPVLIAASSSRVAVRVNDDGTLDTVGEAIGGNAHMCGVQARGLRFDPATGWYSAPQEARDDEPEAWRGRPMRVLAFSGDRAAVSLGARFGGDVAPGEDPRPSDFASCGMRAGFSDMVRVSVPAAEIDAMFAAESTP